MPRQPITLTESDVEQVFAEWWRQWKANPEDYIDLTDADDADEYARGAAYEFFDIFNAETVHTNGKAK